MKFAIRDIIVATSVVALLLALFRVAFGLFLIVNVCLFFGPFAILFTQIVFADQRGTYLSLETNTFYRSIKKLWLLSIGSAIAVWLLIVFGANFFT